jgi:hypothetical protein
MPLAVSFQKMDPMLGAIIIGAEHVCAGANTIGAYTSDAGVIWIYVARTSAPRRPVNDAYLGAKIYGAEVRAYK